MNTYTNKEGQEKTSVGVFVKEIDLLVSKNSNQLADNFSSAPAQPKEPMDAFGDDVPFWMEVKKNEHNSINIFQLNGWVRNSTNTAWEYVR